MERLPIQISAVRWNVSKVGKVGLPPLIGLARTSKERFSLVP